MSVPLHVALALIVATLTLGVTACFDDPTCQELADDLDRHAALALGFATSTAPHNWDATVAYEQSEVARIAGEMSAKGCEIPPYVQ
jgi:hypothetical protein